MLAPEVGELKPGEAVRAVVDRAGAPRDAVQPHRDAPAARGAARAARHARAPGRLGGAARQAALRLHARRSALTPEELRAVEDDVNGWILENHSVRALTTTLDEAKSRGAMALFGEKYGDVVRMVEVGDGSFSRELCGGTHVRSTAEIGLFRIVQRDLVGCERAADRGADGAGGGAPCPRSRRCAARGRHAAAGDARAGPACRLERCRRA